MRELWSIAAKLWWDSQDDPNVRPIKVTPDCAEYWDAPGNLIGNLKVTFGFLTGTHPSYGEHRKVAL